MWSCRNLNDVIVKEEELKLNLVKKNELVYFMLTVMEYEHTEFIL